MSIGLVGLWAVALVSPGPDVVMVVRQSIVDSRRAGIITAFGVVAGISVWIVVAMLGLSAVVAGNPSISRALEIVGGCLLVAIGCVGGWQIFRSRGNTSEPSPDAMSNRAGGSFTRGLVTNIANPKALVFFGALFAQFIGERTSFVDYVIVLAVMVAMAIAWFTGVAVAASFRGFAARYDRMATVVDTVACLVFVAVGAGMAALAL
ncbi:LysE family translocator [Williamsia sp. MIQD14]|uniref:LysE family translocator n=1 Tax=Williamsia sp. MIQD14 TaxID=3425703 RepID=UPI003DA06AAC